MAEVILHSSSGAPNLSQITPPEDGEEFEVQLGESFQHHNTEERYHTLHYAFRPASVESRGVVAKSKDGPIEIEFANANAEQQSSTTYFRGSYQKSRDAECLLIFDPITQTFTLERLSGTARGLKPSGKKPQDSPLTNAKIPPPLTINPAVIKRSNENANGTIVKIKKPKLDTSLPVSEEKDSSSSSSSSSESDKSEDELQDDLDIDSFSASLEESLGSNVSAIPGSQPSQTSPNPPLTQSASWIAPQSNIVNTSSSHSVSSLPSYAMMLRDATSTYSKEPPKVEAVAPVVPTAPVIPRQEPKLVQITQPMTQQLVPNQQQEPSLFSDSDSSSSSSSSDSSSDSSSSDSEPEKTGPQ